ncbi:tetratricopeptide repeat-containing sulfotransferase family protein [Magnetovibrio sp.]|uniref:tetratricopeptide repeat-containing sulfotransferase family protein n=1 Tax=Magnetovibrio sp. TaxID=2024836 RepID=UPI002F94212F
MQNILAEGYQLHRAGKLKQAAQRYQSVLKSAPNQPDALMLLGIVRYEQGDLTQAIKHLAKAIKAAPTNPGAHFNLGLAQQARGRLQDAADAFAQALALAPSDMNAAYCLGAVLVQMGRLDEGKAYLSQALPAMPDNPGVHGWLGVVQQAQGDLKAALQSFNLALQLDPENIEALCGLANMPATSVRPQAAFDYSAKAAKLAPNNQQALLAHATWLEKRRRLEEADQLLASCLKIAPRQPMAHLVKARVELSQGKSDKARERLENLLERDDVPAAVQHGGYAVLGKALDKLGAYEQAFQAFDRKNAAMLAMPESQRLRTDLVPDVIRKTHAWLDNDGPQTLPDTPVSEHTPIFFIAFPRSGTTLMEMILGSHPALQTSGELAAMGAVMDSLNKVIGCQFDYPLQLDTLTDAERRALGDIYWRCFEGELSAPPGERTLIDKNPLNLLYLPLIRTVFPTAKIIMAIRDPRDVCVSNFMQAFSPNVFMIHMKDMPSTAQLYADYMALWRAARGTIGLDVFEYRYEDLIDDFTTTVGGVVSFLNLPWDDAVHDYQRTAHNTIVSTPSYTDVSGRLSRKAIGQWKNYASLMADALDILAADIEAFGYADT